MQAFAYLAIGVFSATSIISPLNTDTIPMPTDQLSKPDVSFSALKTPEPDPVLPGEVGFIGPVMLPETIPSPTPTATPRPIRKTKEAIVKIALLGDSMTDTLGPSAPSVQSALKKIYPGTSFIVKNFGVGGTNIEYGIERITNPYTYLGASYPALTSENPDVVVIESFGYNPFGSDASAIDAHWLLLSSAVDTIKKNLPNAKIVIAATIAPNRDLFGDGAPGVSFSQTDKWERTDTIKKYLENAVRFANSEHLPLADAYHASLLRDGNGNLLYINGGDHIHYSDAGRVLMGTKIANAIVINKLLE